MLLWVFFLWSCGVIILLFSVNLGIIILCSWFSFYFIISEVFDSIFTKKLRNIKKLIKKFDTTFNVTDSLEEILEGNDIIITSLNILNKRERVIYFLLGSENTKQYIVFRKALYLYYIDILLDFKKDIQVHLTVQETYIKSARSEVTKHINWTDELNQVSELQVARLDRQIEQFEELQRILVMV